MRGIAPGAARWATNPAGGGTDADIAIAYRNPVGTLCLWLIEHKLTEAEFHACGGFKSNGRKARPDCDCSRSFADIQENKDTCYHTQCVIANTGTSRNGHRELFAAMPGLRNVPSRARPEPALAKPAARPCDRAG
jgi:hypothetical protein